MAIALLRRRPAPHLQCQWLLLGSQSPSCLRPPRSSRPAKGAGRKPKGAVTGNRAVITTPDRQIGICRHWNGGRGSIEPLLKHCEPKGYRAPSWDDCGWAGLYQVIGNFFGAR